MITDCLFYRQKLKRLQLEQQVRDLETKLRDTVLSQSTHTVQSCAESRQLEQEVRFSIVIINRHADEDIQYV